VGIDRLLGVAMPKLSSAEAVAALGASLRLRHDGSVVDPELVARMDAVLDGLGVRDAVDELDPQETASLLGMIEGLLSQAADFVVHPGRASWDHANPTILLAQGHWSTVLAEMFQRLVVPSLGEEMATRLESGAWFLDVGAGVGALSVAMCRSWPALHVVGVDPWRPALELAHEAVAAAGLEDRIELREAVLETLQESAVYDLAWMPTMFISATVLERAIERLHAALRPDGCAILGLYTRPEDPLMAALADLRTVRQGGVVHTPQDLATLLTRAGFADVEVVVDTMRQAPVVFVTGRRRRTQ
jgi:2-polyprenyl-3-methyl-5-hydroxy-6-metoxy-1,4-benzoquinol methylase